MSAKTCCVTGHRGLPADKIEFVKRELRREILQAIADGYTHFISGFAEGADLIFAAIVAELKQDNKALKLEAAIPYRSRMKSPDKLFQKLIDQCDIVGVHSENYWPGCFDKRNFFMVSVSQRVIAVYDGREKGGTRSTMRYACAQERELKTISI